MTQCFHEPCGFDGPSINGPKEVDKRDNFGLRVRFVGVDTSVRKTTLWVLLFAFQLSCCLGTNPSPEQLDFFETKVRPVFVDHCYSCHSQKAEKVKGDLR